MSRHIFETYYKDEEVKIVAGWDRSLQGFFMTIERLSASGNDDDDNYIYSNLNEENSHTFTPFVRVLVDLGINIPKQMIDEIVQDGIVNAGNKGVVHYYLKDGVYGRRQLYPTETSHLPSQWETLKDVLGEDALKEFMFMASYQLVDGTIVHTYKNFISRAYINISDDLRTWEYTGSGYREISRELALCNLNR